MAGPLHGYEYNAVLSNPNQETERKIEVLTQEPKKSIHYYWIWTVLKRLLDEGAITEQEYKNAMNYYKIMTGADIVLL